jgi:hypothetical protein
MYDHYVRGVDEIALAEPDSETSNLHRLPAEPHANIECRESGDVGGPARTPSELEDSLRRLQTSQRFHNV